MNTFHKNNSRHLQGGYIIVAAMALIAVLLGTGLAFMRWATDESDQSRHAVAGMQAYYLAQLGVIEKGVMWLKTQQAGLLPVTDMRVSGTVTIPGLGSYDDVVIGPVSAQFDEGNFFFTTRKYRISALGHVDVPWMENNSKTTKRVTRKAILYVQVRSFADYMYLTDFEDTVYGETVRFFSGDTLWGRTHSNDQIHIMQSPVFYDVVSTGADDFGRGSGYNPQFLGPDPWFNAVPVYIPMLADTLRAQAGAQGNFFDEASVEYLAQFMGSNCRLWKWEEGTPFDSMEATPIDIPLSAGGSVDGTCIFVNRKLSMYGTVDGEVTIGCGKSITLLEDIRYACCTGNCSPEVPPGCDDYLGIVSEDNVIIGNTPKNGRNNSNGLGNGQTNPNFTDIVITGAIVALDSLDGSFTFAQQNEPGPPPDPYQGPTPDDRGRIHLNGSVTQRHRGYVHRSNHGSTGYLKDYHYDKRMLTHRPPCFFDATDNSGRALFNIVQWGQIIEDPAETREGKFVRYN